MKDDFLLDDFLLDDFLVEVVVVDFFDLDVVVLVDLLLLRLFLEVEDPLLLSLRWNSLSNILDSSPFSLSWAAATMPRRITDRIAESFILLRDW